MERDQKITGRKVLETLAKTYRQLYLDPAKEGADEAYRQIVRRGEEAPEKTLTHFRTSEEDTLEVVETPAGKVQVITFALRSDFELFLQIMANRCVIQEIPKTQGASILNGVINWRRIEAHQEVFLEEAKIRGESEPDWGAEFKRFTSDKENYTDAIVVLSVGPYSGLDASAAGFPEEEWIAYSHLIRMYHECTHFICRRLYPEKIDALWDELVADAIGIYAAFQHYDRRLAERFLGIENGRYTGGRLENYLEKAAGSAAFQASSHAAGITEDTDRQIRLAAVSAWADEELHEIEKCLSRRTESNPYALISLLEERYPAEE